MALTNHKFSSNHKKYIEKSKICGCFYCLFMFNSTDITEWIDDGQTALCPKCSIDSVLPDSCGLGISLDFLIDMHYKWFNVDDKIKFLQEPV